MATIIEDSEPEVVREVHHDHYSDGGGVGTIIGVFLAIILVAILLFYGLPLFRRAMNRTSAPNTINVNLNANVPNNTGGSGGSNPTP